MLSRNQQQQQQQQQVPCLAQYQFLAQITATNTTDTSTESAVYLLAN
jgi:hypothetical protein